MILITALAIQGDLKPALFIEDTFIVYYLKKFEVEQLEEEVIKVK
jgi:hypothetical protein